MSHVLRLVSVLGTVAAAVAVPGTGWAAETANTIAMAPVARVCNIGSCSAEAALAIDAAGREVLTVRDNHADGSSAVAVYWVEGRTGPPTYVWANGAGTTTTHQVEPDVPAGNDVKFRACIGEYGARQVLWDTCGETTSPAGRTPTGPAAETETETATDGLVPAADQLKVMSWNLGAGADFEEINGWADTIATHRPDVVGVQEACKNDIDAVAKRLRETHGLSYQLEYGMVETKAYCGFPTTDFGQAMLSLRTMSNATLVRYEEQNPNEKRGYLYGDVDVDGAVVRIYNTHLEEPGSAELTAQAKELATATMDTPRALVLGDLNASPEVGRNTTYLPPDQQTALVPLFNAGFRDIDRNCNRNTNPGCLGTRDDSLRKFDYIFMRLLSETARPIVPDTTVSDHRPVIGTVQLSPDWADVAACNYNSCVSRVSFHHEGEHLLVEDTNPNGLSAVAVYWVQGRGRNHTIVWNSHGHDSPANPVDANLDIAEGRWIMYRSCSGYGGANTVFWDTCGNVHFAFA